MKNQQKIVWRTEKRKVKDLVPFEANPRIMTPKANEDLKKSIEKFGLVEIPVINASGVILAGHQRARTMIELGEGETEIDVRIPDRELTIAEAEEYLIRSNKNVGDWDWAKIGSFDESILLEAGFSEKDLRKKIVGEKIVPEVEFTQELLEKHNFVVLYFDNEIDYLQISSLLDLKAVQALHSRKGFVCSGTGRVVRGVDAIKKIQAFASEVEGVKAEEKNKKQI